MEQLRPYLALTRFGNSLFGTFSVSIAGVLSVELIGNEIDYLIAGTVSIFLFMGSFSINDYFDHKIDIVNNRKDRPIVIGTISRSKALNIATVCFFLAFFTSLFLGVFPSIFIGFNILLAIVYSSHLKKVLLLKNITIAYCFMATILFGTIIVDNRIDQLVGFYMIMAFLVGFAFEIMADISDMIGDMQHNIKTIASFHSPRVAAFVSSFFFISIFLFDPLPFFESIEYNNKSNLKPYHKLGYEHERI
ncbi:UbiA prenyltransferase-family protein [Methanococcoides burtonii DSM 6242]|uniref:UbiA prenyltransferase-family protein n=1 Tax=Methanococcoides burtonii (strain DSM 6242 / NBRC 107633 / OCM 468 / ACE-M) TaxID=259564 RepID=Q12V55_METBU|nr:UbiA prenyltransferase-family protein [Methanococcoides burtonii DSM 6242]